MCRAVFLPEHKSAAGASVLNDVQMPKENGSVSRLTFQPTYKRDIFCISDLCICI